MTDPAQLYRDLGTTPIINAAGSLTVLGGSRISPAVQEAMIAANRHYVEMESLLLRTGSRLGHGRRSGEFGIVSPSGGRRWLFPG